MQIKISSPLSESQLAAVLHYSGGTVVNGETVISLAAIPVVRKIVPDVQFVMAGTNGHTCIVSSMLSMSEVAAKIGAPVTDLGMNLYKAAVPGKVFNSLLNDTDIIDIQVNDTEIDLMHLDTTVSPFANGTSIVSPGTTDVQVDLASITASTSVPVDASSWALPRIFNRVSPYLESITRFNPISNVNTTVYLMDSGINKDHVEFEGNVSDLHSFTGNFADTNGHGTSLASAIVGKTCGVSPDHVHVKNVKIFDAAVSTTLEDLVTAFNAIVADAQANPGNHVVNMSWVISKNTIVENIIQQMIDTYNIKFVCAAGNSGRPIELLTPASMRSILTVGAIDPLNAVCGFTNYNTEPLDPSLPLFTETSVDVFAPGAGCKAANYLDINGYIQSTGTSIASAYVAGVAAYMSLLLYPSVSSQQALFNTIVDYSTKELLTLTTQYSLMPNRIIWALNDCTETKVVDTTMLIPPDKILNARTGNTYDLTMFPSDRPEIVNDRKLVLDMSTNCLRTATTEVYLHGTSYTQVAVDDYTAAGVYDLPYPRSTVARAINNNYFTTFNITFADQYDALDITLQYKTDSSYDDCGGSGCYTTNNTCIGGAIYKDYSWKYHHASCYTSVRDGQVCYSHTCGSECDYSAPGCCYGAC